MDWLFVTLSTPTAAYIGNLVVVVAVIATVAAWVWTLAHLLFGDT